MWPSLLKISRLFFKQPHKVLILLISLILLTVGCDIAVPLLSKKMVDHILLVVNGSGDSWHMLVILGAAIFIATIFAKGLRSFYNYKLFLVASKIEDMVKVAAFKNFISLDTSYHTSVNTGELVGALDRGGTSIFIVLYEILGQGLLPPLLIAVAGTVILLQKHRPIIALMIFLPLPIYWLCVAKLGKRLDENERNITTAFEKVSIQEYDVGSNVEIVKRFCQEDNESSLQTHLLEQARTQQYAGERFWNVVDNLQTIISSCSRVGVITYGGCLALFHQCTVGEYVLFMALQDMVFGPLCQLSALVPKLRRNLARAEKLFETWKRTSCIVEGPHVFQGTSCSVEFQNVSFRYSEAGRWILQEVNLAVPAGSTVAVIGPSGAGKSTLVNLIQRLYDPQKGSILINGINIRDFTTNSLRRHISVVPQEVGLFSRSISENIRYGQGNVDHEDVKRAALNAHASAFIEHLDAGYECQVGERGLRLSGGERQRIALSRAILRNSEILILDEATSHLDNENERLIQMALEELNYGRTCFILAHRLSTIEKADIVIVVNEGRIESLGNHHELWDTSTTYRTLYAANQLGIFVRDQSP